MIEKCTYCGEESSNKQIYVGGYHVPETHESCIREINEREEDL